MTETFSRYDSAGFLKTEEDIAAYVEACMSEGELVVASDVY